MVGSTDQERGALREAFNVLTLTEAADQLAEDPAELAELEEWASQDYIPATLLHLRRTDAEVNLIDVGSEHPDFSLVQDYERAKENLFFAFSFGESELVEKQELVLRALARNVAGRDKINAHEIHELTLQDDKGLAVVVGAGHIGLKALLEQQGHDVTTAFISLGEMPYDIQAQQQLNSEGAMDPMLVKRALLVEACNHYRMVDEMLFSQLKSLPTVYARSTIQEAVQQLDDPAVNALVESIVSITSSELGVPDKKQHIAHLLHERLQ
ncbi:MAG: hypothetical protein AAB834_05700 [Patescibacteria group bacterium]